MASVDLAPTLGLREPSGNSFAIDRLPEKINDMKISDDKEMEATVVNGHGTETGHIIVIVFICCMSLNLREDPPRSSPAKRLQNGIFVPGCYSLAVSGALSDDLKIAAVLPVLPRGVVQLGSLSAGSTSFLLRSLLLLALLDSIWVVF